MEDESTNQYYEVTLSCISKKEAKDSLKTYYRNILENLFHNEPKYFYFNVKTFSIKDIAYNSTASKILLYKKLDREKVSKQNVDIKDVSTIKQNNKNNIIMLNNSKDHKDNYINKQNNKNIKDNKDNKSFKYYTEINKEKLYSTITFNEKLGQFLESSNYFIKHVSNKKIEPSLGITRMIEIARCGCNMEDILIAMGYSQTDSIDNCCLYYQYKYYPIIALKKKFQGEPENIHLEIKGYYYENTKEEIEDILKDIKKSLNESFLFYNYQNKLSK